MHGTVKASLIAVTLETGGGVEETAGGVNSQAARLGWTGLGSAGSDVSPNIEG
jgi:hypothetical protein